MSVQLIGRTENCTLQVIKVRTPDVSLIITWSVRPHVRINSHQEFQPATHLGTDPMQNSKIDFGHQVFRPPLELFPQKAPANQLQINIPGPPHPKPQLPQRHSNSLPLPPDYLHTLAPTDATFSS